MQFESRQKSKTHKQSSLKHELFKQQFFKKKLWWTDPSPLRKRAESFKMSKMPVFDDPRFLQLQLH